MSLIKNNYHLASIAKNTAIKIARNVNTFKNPNFILNIIIIIAVTKIA